MPTSSNFSGLWIPLITPFSDGAVDHHTLARLAQQLRTAGIAGFVVCGSTGEAAALDKLEQLAVLETVIRAADGLPIIMGVSGYHLPDTVVWIKTLTRYPLAGLLVPPPHYIRPSQSGLVQWFCAIADAAAVPVVIYDIPYRTGVTMALETLRTLAHHPNIQAIKDCGGDAAKTQALIADGKFQVLAGEDAQLFSTVALGGAGAIAACAHLHTRQFVRVLESIASNNMEQARRLWRPLQPLIIALFAEPNPGPLKAALANLGWVRNELRLPMTVATAAHVETLERLYQEADLS